MAEHMDGMELRRFRYFVPSSYERLCYGGGILPNARASALARLQIPCLVASEFAALTRMMTRRRFDLLHAHFLVPQGAVCALTRGHVPLVVSVHGSDLSALPRADVVRRAVLARAAIVTVNGEATRRELVARFPEVAAKVRTLPMGFDPELFRGKPAAAHGDPILAFVGRMTKEKGLSTLLEAFERLVADGRRLRLVVGGEGPERARPCPGVTYLGRLSPSSVASLFREAAVVVVPSLVEAQGLVAVEAMAAGVPLVASRVGGLAELVGDEERGWLAPPGDATGLADAIARALDCPEAARARADAARTYVHARYAWSSLRATLLGIYDEAAAWR